ncbi:MFS general substrate transporter [Backusella circina FSU 941]|nr:MFS general substrate transporter [Backusella circina FSU 941]
MSRKRLKEDTKNQPEVDENTKQSFPMEDILDPKVERRLLLKLDFRLLSFAFFSYFTSNLVRNNMQSAYTNGMDKAVNLDSEAYNWCVTFFFIGYIIPQIPTNMIVARILPKYFLPTAEIIWGIVTCCISLSKSPGTVYGLRFILGFAQATFVPSMVFIIGSWYTSQELGTRTAIFMAGNQISGAIGGVIAGGINLHLNGANGIAGWQYLFIIEGAMSIFVGLCGYYLLPNYPHNTNWITGIERELAIARLERQGKQIKSQKYTWNTFKNVLLTPYAYILVIDFIGVNIGNQIPLNFSIILRSMVIVVQIWVSIWYLIFFAVNHGDSPFWLVMLGSFMVVLSISVFPVLFAFINEIFAADANTRALAIACINCIGNLVPNFISVGVWKVSYAPQFFLGKVVTFALSVVSVIVTFICWVCVKKKFHLPCSDVTEVFNLPPEEEIPVDFEK